MRTYLGSRYESQCVVSWRADHRLTPQHALPMYLRERAHSPDGPEWGYCGGGPAQLAYALLRHATDRPEIAERLYQQYKQDVVSCLPHDGWELSQESILDWVAAQLAGPIV